MTKPAEQINQDALSASPNCPFCQLDPSMIISQNKSVVAFRDKFPVSSGHTLVIPRRHIADATLLNDLEASETMQLMRSIAADLRASDAKIKGFNIGYNVAEAAGQTVMHAHMHIIPRRDGDVADPTGGIRGVIPAMRRY
jgi:ATP adenylyltransferase